MSDETKNIIDSILAAIGAKSVVVKHGEESFAVVPEGYNIQSLEAYDPKPRFIRASPLFVSLDSFIKYVKEFKDDSSKVFANSITGALSARLDGDRAGDPSWKTHAAIYSPLQTEEWKRWIAQDNKYVGQAEFAEFVESNVQDITRPNGATMLEIAKTFEAKTATEFKSGVRLDNGNQKLTFAQETTARAGTSNELEIPQEFDLALTPFAFGEAFPVKARLRYRVGDDKSLKLKYQLINPHKVIESVVLRLIDRVSEETEISTLIGNQ